MEHATRLELDDLKNQITKLQTGDFLSRSVLRQSLDLADKFALYDLSPSQITANQNDYNIQNASVLRLSSNAARTITGFAGGKRGRLLIIQNIGSFTITLAHQNTSSNAKNRLISPTGANFPLYADSCCFLSYDFTTQRWRLLSMELLGTMTNGQLLIGSTGAHPAFGTLTAGSGVTITNGAGSITIAASGGFSQIRSSQRWQFHSATARQDSSSGTGVGISANTNGLYLETIDGYKKSIFYLDAADSLSIFKHDSFFSCLLRGDTAGNIDGAQIYAGLGLSSIASTGHTFTEIHAGWKFIRDTGGVVDFYATQGDGTAESATLILNDATFATNWELMLKITTDSSIDYYYRNGANALSAATNIATNVPAGSTTNPYWATFSCTQNGGNTQWSFFVRDTLYER